MVSWGRMMEISKRWLRTKRTGAVVAAVLFFCLPYMQAALAADISCADTWSETGGVNAGGLIDEQSFKERFPSGRRPTPASCREIYIKGDIVTGDAEKFLQVLQQNHPFVSTVILASHGGNLAEAIEIGQLVRKYLLITVVPSLPQTVAINSGRLDIFPGGFISDGQHLSTALRTGTALTTLCQGMDCFCASACTDIWASGSIRYGNFLGVHQVFTEQVENRDNVGLSPASVRRMQPEALAYNQQYLENVEIPEKLLKQLADTSPYGVSWVAPGDMRQMTFPPSTLKLLESCNAQIYVFQCFVSKLSALRDAMDAPADTDTALHPLVQAEVTEQK